MKKILMLVVCFGFVSGCAALPGSIRESVSGFDKTNEIVLEPAWLYKGTPGLKTNIKIGIYKTSKMYSDKAILVVVVMGINNLSNKETLQFNIDGEILSFEPIDSLTNIETEPGVYDSVVSVQASDWSSRRYEVTKDFVKKLIEGKDVWVKVNLLSREYIEGKFSQDGIMLARPAFRKFYRKVWGDEDSKEK